jgi:hypothetical protein
MSNFSYTICNGYSHAVGDARLPSDPISQC